ncbi:MAG: phospholipid carrier-dependent glycosyltransferase [Sphingobacteriales bacterium]|nr:MAG: phospholipid carrier-dependent glycosyltransferase [Sphingobacteriales bacterium]
MITSISGNNARQYLPGLVLLLLAVIIGVCTYQDYGIAWDEPIQREMGQASYNYVFKNDPKLLTYIEKDHGVGFELPLIMIEEAGHIEASRDIFLMRHLVTHLFYLLCCFAGYVLVQNLFKNRLLACLAFLLLAYHPRLYAHSFFNSKDVPLAGMFLVSFMLAEMAFRKNKAWLYVLLGLSVGYASSIRILGIVLVCPIMLFFLFDMINHIKTKKSLLPVVANAVLFIISSTTALYIAFPTLWSAPVANFIDVFRSLSHFRWGGKVLFEGQMLLASELPRYYLLKWLAITTPVILLLSGITGLIWIVVNSIKTSSQFYQSGTDRNFLLYAFCLVVPLAIIIGMHSIVYDDWRHVYFVYPAFVLLAVYTIHKLSARYAQLVLIVIVLQLIDVGYFMVRSHPHHQVYFNQLVSHKEEYLRNNYELDYWGSSYKQGLDYILANDTAAKVRIFESLPPVYHASIMLTQQQKKRILFVDRNDFPYYFITGFRNHPNDYYPPEVGSTFYEVKVLNSTILRVYRCNKL